MCGFAGFIDYSGASDKATLEKMRDCLHHRGPDDAGLEILNSDDVAVGLGFRRLSIQDLSPAGHQPMFSDDKKICIILNGEIYNFKEIRNDLLKKGYLFKSNSDTEVVIQAYREYGIKCLNLFIGMFAICLYDYDKRRVYLIRDRAGVKPLYYYLNEKVVLFASELKAFHQHPSFIKKLDQYALALYFQHGYIPAPHTIFQHTYKVKPGHYLEFNLTDQDFTDNIYWSVDAAYKKGVAQIDYKSALEEGEQLFTSAAQYRMIADVPVGVFLSGGYDSTLVTALLQKETSAKIKTYTIGFSEKEYDESSHARAVAGHLGTEHHELICSVNDAKPVIPMLPEMYDEPFADSSAIPTYLVSKMARNHVTVALSADAGDESFAGYTKYIKCLSYIDKFEKLPVVARTAIGVLSKVTGSLQSISPALPDRTEKMRLLMKSKTVADAFNIITQQMTQREVRSIFKEDVKFPATAFEDEYSGTTTLNQMLWCDYKTYLPDDILCKVDRATMAVSLEGREPLLDHRIIEFAATLPDEFKIGNGSGKKIMKDIVHKYVPKDIMERPKMGFRIPVNEWIRTDLKEEVQQYFEVTYLKRQGIFNAEKVNDAFRYAMSKPGNDMIFIWKMYVFQMWYQHWLE